MLDYTHLEALLAVENEGSYESAGKRLGMSAIGVAKRIRKLEERMGVPLVARSPTRPTEAGAVVCKYTSEIMELENLFLLSNRENGLQPASDVLRLKVAVNDESIACWFLKVLQEQDGENSSQPLYEIKVVDQDHSIEMMRRGEVVAAMSGQKQPVHGFKSFPLGQMTYQAIASPGFVKKNFGDGELTLDQIISAPCIRRSGKDSLCIQWLEQTFEATTKINTWRLPDLSAIIDACIEGNGWAVVPERKISTYLDQGMLIKLVAHEPLRKELYWHVSEIMYESMTKFTKAIKAAADL